jgi:hypothetical protein
MADGIKGKLGSCNIKIIGFLFKELERDMREYGNLIDAHHQLFTLRKGGKQGGTRNGTR